MQQTWAALTRAKVVSDSNPSVSAAPGRYKIANALMLKAAWLCCVLGGIYYGLPAIAAMFVLSFWQRELAKDRPFVIALGLIGLCLDTFWMYAGVLDYGDAALNLAPSLNIAPAWIVMLWLAVGLSIRHSLIFLVNRPVLGALLVGGGAPLSYLTGESFGAVAIPSVQGLVVLALTWVVLFFFVFSRAKSRLTAE
jgi:hypothetical protein